MGLIEIAILGVGLSMDACCVSMTNGMVYSKLRKLDYALMPLLFGIFQGVMPLIGYFAGNLFAEIITKYSGIVILLILGIIGGKMILDSFKKENDEERCNKLTITVLLLQAVATSIDAFAVGVGLCAVQVNIIPAVIIIAVITAVLTVGAILIGKKFGDIFESKAQLLGGIILVIIGIKAII